MNPALNKALVVGGSVAGMAAAISLARCRMTVELIDRDPDWRTHGAGITNKDGLVLTEEMTAASSLAEGWTAFAARRFERARLVVENSVGIGQLERQGGHDEDVRELMSQNTHALAAAI